MKDFTVINPLDNVGIMLVAANGIPSGHKFALRDIREGEHIIKYGLPIGIATRDITKGEWVHVHNVKSLLSGEEKKYVYNPILSETKVSVDYFDGFKRSWGRAGIRNDIFIVPTVGCVNSVAKAIEKESQKFVSGSISGVYALTHQFGCSQLGGDNENIGNLLKDVALNPNAAGVLFVGLGCENNQVGAIMQKLEGYKRDNLASIVCQEVNDDVACGVEIIRGFAQKISEYKRSKTPLSDLTIGLKCGGSDGFSGLTSNPLVGKVCDMAQSAGASAVFTEVPEMFGAEEELMQRCKDEQTFDKFVLMINGFKKYYTDAGFPVYENPSPGNKAGGITTLEEKSLGCVEKAGTGVIQDVLSYGDIAVKSGLSALNAPGNDLIAATALAAAGCQLVLFTTGRGTPFSTFVPTVKISSNSALYDKKSAWIDFDAQKGTADELYALIKKIASGEKKCKSEDYREIAFFKTGVTL